MGLIKKEAKCPSEFFAPDIQQTSEATAQTGKLELGGWK